MENYSAPTGRLWFMYSNLELFRVQKACLYTAAEGQIANRTGTFTLALLGSKLTSLWAAGANSPQSLLKQRDRNSGETEKKTLKNSLTPDFSLACEACDNKPQWKRCAACCEFAVEPTYSQTPAWWCTPAWQPSPLSIADSNPLPGASCSSAITTMVGDFSWQTAETKPPLCNVLSYRDKFPPHFSSTKADHLIHLTGLAQNCASLSWPTSA